MREFGNRDDSSRKEKRRKPLAKEVEKTPFKKEKLSDLSSSQILYLEPGFAASISKHQQYKLTNKKGSDHWKRGVYNSSVASYEKTFRPVLNDKKIEQFLLGKSHPVVLDLMAPSGTVADLFMKGGMRHLTNKQAIALSLTDERTIFEQERDNSLGIIQMVGDLGTSKTWRRLEAEIAKRGGKIDLIIERAGFAFDSLPQHPQFYRYALVKLWNLLSEKDGTMLLQLPSKINADIDFVEWETTLQRHSINVSMDLQPNFEVMRLTKEPSSPHVLPFIVSK